MSIFILLVVGLVCLVLVLLYNYGPPSMWRYLLFQIKRYSPDVSEVDKKVFGYCGKRYDVSGANDVPVTTIYRMSNGYSLLRRCCDAWTIYLDAAGNLIAECFGNLPPSLLSKLLYRKCVLAAQIINSENREYSHVNLCTGREGPAD